MPWSLLSTWWCCCWSETLVWHFQFSGNSGILCGINQRHFACLNEPVLPFTVVLAWHYASCLCRRGTICTSAEASRVYPLVLRCRNNSTTGKHCSAWTQLLLPHGCSKRRQVHIHIHWTTFILNHWQNKGSFEFLIKISTFL